MRKDSWSAASPEVRDRISLLAEIELHLQWARVFITTKEKAHPCGVDLHDELLAKVTAAIDAFGKESDNG